jgi:hypothetical protein
MGGKIFLSAGPVKTLRPEGRSPPRIDTNLAMKLYSLRLEPDERRQA